MAGTVQLSVAATRLARKGRPWFFADDLGAGAADGSSGDGELVRVLAHDGRDLGLGFTSARSRICLRLCGRWEGGPEPPAPEEFFRARLAAAIARRAALRGPRCGTRLVHGESDGLPGLVVDEYADCAVLQATAAAVERHYDAIVPALVDLCGARSVIARNDTQVRKLEGLPLEVRLLHGRRVEEVEIDEHGVTHVVRPFVGHKTGFYLDQRPARGRVKELAAAARTVLDLFCYQGAFALAALAGGARSVLAVDQSESALALARRGAERNRLDGLETREASAFDAVRELRKGARFDLIVVDPPAFAKSRREREGALRGYRDLNRHALRLLAPGGTLVACSCSHHVTGPMFEDVLRQAAADLPFHVVLRERIMAAPDHPVWISLPESEYLKVCVLQRVDLQPEASA